MPEASTNAAPSQGQLRDTPLPNLLMGLYARRTTGTLILRRARSRKTIALQEGAPISVTSNVTGESLSALLERTGKLSEAEQRRLAQHAERQGCSEAAALLTLHLLTPKELFCALSDQLRRGVVDCFGWPDGEYVVQEGETVGSNAHPLRSDPYGLVVEGLATHWGPDRILADLAPKLDRCPERGSEFASVSRRLSGEAAVDTLLAGFDGERSLGEILAGSLGSARALATVWVLDAARLVRYVTRGATADGVEGVLATEIEIEVSDSSPGHAVTHETRAAQPKASANAPGPAHAETMRAEVLERLSQLGDLDHYELLGVDHDATAGALKKAYFTAAKRYHPDSLARLQLSDLKEDAGKVFAQIALAYEVLSDAGKRADYDAELSDEVPNVDAATLAQAETFYRKGEILVRMGDFKGAVEYLANAVELYPDECDYQSALGWSLYKKASPDLEGAVEHLETAVRLGPENAVAHLRLGTVLTEIGRDAEGARHLARASDLDPNAA